MVPASPPRRRPRALTELEDLGLVSVRRDQVKAGLALKGYTYHLYYSLNGDFSTAARATARTAAKKGAASRAAAAAEVDSAGKKKGPAKRSATRPVKKGSRAKRSATRSPEGGLKRPKRVT